MGDIDYSVEKLYSENYFLQERVERLEGEIAHLHSLLKEMHSVRWHAPISPEYQKVWAKVEAALKHDPPAPAV